MIFEMNEERKSYLDARGKIVLNACPGSGKTTCLVEKLMSLRNDYGRYSGVACLSFTNTAKDEINQKYYKAVGSNINFPNHVSTIDSFINQYITLPFFYLLKNEYGRPIIVDEKSILDKIWTNSYIDKKGKPQVGIISSLKPFLSNSGKNLFHIYPPSSIRVEKDKSFSSNGKKSTSATVEKSVFIEYCKLIKKIQFSKGLLSSDDSEFAALTLLTKYPAIAKYLSMRFPHIIIDEAQDTSEIQYAIIDKLIEAGLKNIELIGDPYQSIYEWRNAKPELFLDKYYGKDDWNPLDLTNNRRSPQKIVNAFSLVRKATDKKISSTCPEDLGLPIIIYKYNSDNAKEILKLFDDQCVKSNLTQSQVVVRGNEFKDDILGKKADLKPWKNNFVYEIITAQHLYYEGNVKDSIRTIRKVVLRLQYPSFSHAELRKIETNLENSPLFNSLLLEIIHSLPGLDETIDNWTTGAESLINQKVNLVSSISFDKKTRGSSNFKLSSLTQPVSQHFKPSVSEQRIPITTIHQVKGKSLDSILIFFSETGGITFNTINNTYKGIPTESQRIVYVAMSRPMHLLAMAFPESVTNESILAKFGIDVQIVEVR